MAKPSGEWSVLQVVRKVGFAGVDVTAILIINNDDQLIFKT